MKIVAFSEVKWSYLSTRKRQILSRLPNHWQILFLEPYKAGHPNSLLGIQDSANVIYVTVPFLKNFKPRWLAKIFSLKIVRWLHYVVLKLWIKEVIRYQAFHSPDVVFISNLYAVPVLEMFPSSTPVIYDQNDNHMAFPNTPIWLKGYLNRLCEIATKIVSVSEELACNLPIKSKIEIIGNGVDTALFESKPVILYVGAISGWIDVDLLHKISEHTDWTLRLIGPVSVDLKRLLNKKNVQNVVLPQELAFEQMKNADVLIVPFLRNDLTKDSHTINKLYEYMMTNSTIISTNFSDGLKQYKDFIVIAGTHEEFISALKLTLTYNLLRFDIAERRRFAESNDWSFKAKQMEDVIKNSYQSLIERGMLNRLEAHKEIDET